MKFSVSTGAIEVEILVTDDEAGLENIKALVKEVSRVVKAAPEIPGVIPGDQFDPQTGGWS